VIHEMMPIVRATAIGSLKPDSTERTLAIRRRMAVNRSAAKTAAASVEPTIAPSSKALDQLRSRSPYAQSPTTAAVTTTPTLLSVSAGTSARRSDRQSVVSPPSNRMATRPITPIARASSASSK
jgi:hypothetical protein